MAEHNQEKPLTVDDVYETLIPAMEEVFSTKEELGEFRNGFEKFRNEVLTGQDKILKDLEILMAEKEMGIIKNKKSANYGK